MNASRTVGSSAARALLVLGVLAALTAELLPWVWMAANHMPVETMGGLSSAFVIGSVVVKVLVILVVGALLWSVLGDAGRGGSFTPRNVSLLRVVGWVLVVSGVLVPLVAAAIVMQHGGSPLMALASSTSSLLRVAAGLGALALARVVDRGAQLEHDVDGLV